MTNRHLGTAQLYTEVREAIEDMSQYLDSDVLRRQGETMVRLTVVTTVGLIGMATTGFLGMNLIAEADSPFVRKLFIFLSRSDPNDSRDLYTMLKSRRLSEFLEKVSDELRLGESQALQHSLMYGEPSMIGCVETMKGRVEEDTEN